ncbi:hypothetical protein A3J90_04840 [candidate division WOR-1 bacterium RIFOXYC2_FULL_37_10]|uniref:Ribbon-helix-helix protein CopG domain-containing protein n=1 Tax=candidate division WOR-1 bacterium RIFOXYB2_FULL_37_13 TaxID=1802579 RepID=A0A1F4SVI4_UNCSA|nr:MAG: hypothetical protein A2246_05035 [candidate division WOR-1 bacterium RIFOXYA2_FULL_37_7]OGC24451.1 MAG: hypothetical protein A2310_08610 [candidate division WOR-1 bacterium RIFOXYB2_FULL_37_13]OGC35548.1 MAG: hypothetical protein A3J90_04840 [candidate division WOR-1 bacterium RIFOXYC2_FULL_37_10]
MLTKKIQVLLEEEEYNKLKRIGQKYHKSIGSILRESAEIYASRLPTKEGRLLILDKIRSFNAPVSTWEKEEAKIMQARKTGK